MEGQKPGIMAEEDTTSRGKPRSTEKGGEKTRRRQSKKVEHWQPAEEG